MDVKTIVDAIRSAFPPWHFKARETPLGGNLDWIRQTLELRSPETPTTLINPSIIPILDILSVATRPVADVATLAVPGTPQQLPNVPGALVTLQALSTNGDLVSFGFGNGNFPFTLAPGQSVEMSIPNLNWIFFDSLGGVLPVSLGFVVLQAV